MSVKVSNMNVLVTAVGSMSAEFVVSSLRKSGFGVLATDIYSREFHPVVEQCMEFALVPKAVHEPDAYCQALIDLCVRHGCSAVMPLTDPEVDVLSAHRGDFAAAGVDVWLASTSAITLARDKSAWGELLAEAKTFRVIPSYPSFAALDAVHSGRFVAKRVHGRSSEGILFGETETFSRSLLADGDYLFQPFIPGRIVTVDFVRHPNSGETFSVARAEMLRTKNGAGTAVEMLGADFARDAVGEVCDRLGLSGVMNCEFIQTDGGLHLMDINPRFSAGVSFSGLAGYDFVAADVACYLEDSLPPHGAIPGGRIFVKRYADFEVSKI